MSETWNWIIGVGGAVLGLVVIILAIVAIRRNSAVINNIRSKFRSNTKQNNKPQVLMRTKARVTIDENGFEKFNPVKQRIRTNQLRRNTEIKDDWLQSRESDFNVFEANKFLNDVSMDIKLKSVKMDISKKPVRNNAYAGDISINDQRNTFGKPNQD